MYTICGHAPFHGPSPKEDADDETEWVAEDEEAIRKQAFDMQYSMFADQGYQDPRAIEGGKGMGACCIVSTVALFSRSKSTRQEQH